MYRKSNLGGGSRYFRPTQYTLQEDGALTIKASGYEDDATQWTGWVTLSPSDTDYDFWFWMARIQRVPELVQERELSKWKAIYKTQTDLAGSETVWFDPLLKQPRKKAPVK